MARKRSRRVRPAEELVTAAAVPAVEEGATGAAMQPMFEFVESGITPRTRLEELAAEPDDER